MFRINFGLSQELKIGFSGQIGSYESDSLQNLSRQRFGAHIEYYGEDRKFRFRGELMTLDNQVAATVKNISVGGYILGGYKIAEKPEGIGRIAYYQPDNKNDTYYGLTIGGNYNIANRTRLSLNGMASTDANDFNKI